MVVRKIYILFLFFLIRIQFCLSAATVVVPDANFRAFLIANYPGVMVGPLLDTVPAAAVTGTFNCRAKSISNIYGIQYFKSITNLNLNSNNLVSIPELKNFINLQRISADSNLLTNLPTLNTIPTLMGFSFKKNNLTSLPALVGLLNLEFFYCGLNDITSLPSLNGLSKLTTLECSENKLTQLPNLNSLINLENLYCSANLITSLPSLDNLVKLKLLYCGDNLLTSLPNLNNSTLLNALRITNNKITSLPSLPFTTFPTQVYLDYNNLTFEDLLPIVNGPYYSGVFTLFPQNNFGTYADTLIKKHGTFNFNLLIDASLGASNTYKWYKDGVLVTTGNVNFFSISDVAFSDSGVYNVVVKNTNLAFASDSIVSTFKKMKVSECFSGSTLSYMAENISCSEGFKITLDASKVTGGTAPFKYVLRNLSNGEIRKGFNLVFAGVKEGDYSITIKDAASCEAPLVFIQLVSGSNCDPVFSPNGDGVADTYFIGTPGKAKIFNRNGVLIHELATPAYWDGLDKNGIEVPSGYYAIIIDDKTSTNVSLMR